jgi:flagellar export protein FliJ
MTARNSGEFRLETVLRVATRREEQVAQEFGLLEQAYRVEAEHLRRLLEEQAVLLDAGVASQAPGDLDVHWLDASDRYAEVLAFRIAYQAERVEQCLGRVQEGRARLLEATQKRKMLDTLKEQDRKRWRAELDRSEAAEMAEIGTARFLRHRSETAAQAALQEAAR